MPHHVYSVHFVFVATSSARMTKVAFALKQSLRGTSGTVTVRDVAAKLPGNDTGVASQMRLFKFWRKHRFTDVCDATPMARAWQANVTLRPPRDGE
jgi:hypothetical protein